jgi:hypothetical protein
MGSQHHQDLARFNIATMRGQRGTKPRSDHELTRQALKEFRLPENSAERLRRKFRGQKQKWLDIAALHDDVPDQLEFNLLTDVRGILAHRGIGMNLERIER